jgi:hypothetical protein
MRFCAAIAESEVEIAPKTVVVELLCCTKEISGA